MCFDQKSSFGFAGCGLFASWWIYSNTKNRELATGVFFFFTMEFLQGLQYFVIAEEEDYINNTGMCLDMINQFLTMLGFLHICLQPYYCHVINASLTQDPKYIGQYKCIKRLCLLGGATLFGRFLMGYYGYGITEGAMKTGFHMEESATGYWPRISGVGESTEWLRGEKLCTFNGKYHLAWGIPMADPTYYVPGAGIHSFLMYAPFIALYEKKGMILQGCVLFFTGPALSAFITPNLMEQASIWCFFSIAQICTMLFGIREVLIVEYGKDGQKSALFAAKPELAAKAAAKAAKIASKGKTA